VESTVRMGFPPGIASSGTRNPPEEGDSTGNYQLIYSESGRLNQNSPKILRTVTIPLPLPLLTVAKPLLTVAPTVPKVLVTPMPRYAHKKCCDKQGHVTNMGPGMLAELTAGLKSVKKSIRSFLFREKISGVRIFDPHSVVNFADPETFADPVHLKAAGYLAIAEGILESMAGGAEGDSAADPPSATENNKRIRILSVSGRGGTGAIRGRGFFRGGPAARGGRPRRGRGSGNY
jgi:hypothetical protein